MKTIYFIVALIVTQFATAQIENNSFSPIKGKKYVLHAWVKDDVAQEPVSYDGHIELVNHIINGDPINLVFLPTGAVIDGWQHIETEFVVHANTSKLELKLVSIAGGSSYFDDVRIFPFNGNMKSFVYDHITQRLMAELDENNYATYYEYDVEGGLVRVKKETERGVYTIQETRSGNSTLNNN